MGKGRGAKGVVKAKKSVGAVGPRKKQNLPTAREPEEHATQDWRAKELQRQEDEPEDSAGSSSDDDSGRESDGEVGVEVACLRVRGQRRPAAAGAEPAPRDHPLQAGEIPFGELQQLRQDGSTTAEAMKARAAALRRSGGAQQFKREGKHRPMEAPSKKPVPVFRDVFQSGKRCAGREA